MPDLTRFRLASLNLNLVPERLRERQDLMIAELRQLQPDAVCFQEIVNVPGAYTPEEVAAALGWPGVAFAQFAEVRPGVLSGNVIISKHKLEASTPLGTFLATPMETPPVAVTVTVQGRPVHVISAHLKWGADWEAGRQVQALALDQYAREVVLANPGTTVLIGGDFNALPTSDTSRFFNGDITLQGKSTTWVDAWAVAGTPENETTSRNDNHFARQTAELVGISRPDLIPARRIDYLKGHGWAYGRSGCPLEFGRWADSESDDGLSISDHYGIWADFLLL